MELKNIDIVERMKHFNVAGLSLALIKNGNKRTQCFGKLEAGTNRVVNDESIFNACSISKFLTSMLALMLTELGLLDLDEDVNNKLFSWQIPDNELVSNKKVTLRSLLSHQSGLTDPQGSFDKLDFTHQAPTIVDLLNGMSDYCSEPIEVKYLPESDFQYSDAGFSVIQQLIQDVTGDSFIDVMKRYIFHPLQMDNSHFINTPHIIGPKFSCGHNKNGDVVKHKYPIYPYPAASGLWTTPTDLVILVSELMNALKGKSVIGLSKSMAQQMISPQFERKWAGLGVFLDGSDQGIEISSLGWGVGFQSLLLSYPESNSGIVIMTNTDLGFHQMKGIIGEIVNSIQV